MSVVAAATVAVGAMGAYSSNKASKRAQQSANEMTEAGREAAQLGRDQFDWYKQEYERTRPQREAAAAMDQQIAEQQFQGMQYAMDQARELDARRKGVFQPLEDKLIAEANEFDTDAKREQLAGEAMADVNRAFGSARGQQTRELARMGVDPSSGRALAIGEQGKVAQALELARAGTQTRQQARAEGRALKMDAIGIGRGVIGNQATMQSLAQNGGNAAVGAAGAGVNVNQSGAPLMAQGFGSAMQGYGTMSGLFGQGANFQNQANNWTNQRNSAIGSMFGAGVDYFSPSIGTLSGGVRPTVTTPSIAGYGPVDSTMLSKVPTFGG